MCQLCALSEAAASRAELLVVSCFTGEAFKAARLALDRKFSGRGVSDLQAIASRTSTSASLASALLLQATLFPTQAIDASLIQHCLRCPGPLDLLIRCFSSELGDEIAVPSRVEIRY